MNNDFKVIVERIEYNFTRKRNTVYWLQIVNDRYDATYNFFINIHPQSQRVHSIPLHTVEEYNLSYLEKIVDQISHKYQLTIVYDGFTGLKWPIKQELIQRRRHEDE